MQEQPAKNCVQEHERLENQSTTNPFSNPAVYASRNKGKKTKHETTAIIFVDLGPQQLTAAADQKQVSTKGTGHAQRLR